MDMKFLKHKHLGKITLLLIMIAALSSCSTVNYYYQAVSGHMDLVSKERLIDEVISDSETTEQLKQKLQLAKRAREFGSNELGLPDNESYTTYADLERPYVVWNVIATPAYSIKAKQWCFMIVGCISYRGYFGKDDAIELADELKAEGLDVQVSGATAYSTLGYFDDPLLKTMMNHSDASLVGIIFHELAHQVIYIDGDTAFNEAFASTVEQEGLRRWFEGQSDPQKYEQYISRKKTKHEFYQLLKKTRVALQSAFEQAETDSEKSSVKQKLYEQLQQDYTQWRDANHFYQYDNWMQRDLNNAHLALIATYQDLVPNFIMLLATMKGDLPAFYKKVAELGELDKDQRNEQLTAFNTLKTGSK